MPEYCNMQRQIFVFKSRCIDPTANSIDLIIFSNVTISFNSESRSGGILLTKQLFLYEERKLAFKLNILYCVTTSFLVGFINGTP